MERAQKILGIVTTITGAAGPAMAFTTIVQLIRFMATAAEKLGESDKNLDALEHQINQMVNETRGPTPNEWEMLQLESDELANRIANA